MNDPKEWVAELVSHPTIIAYIYEMVHLAGIKAVYDLEVHPVPYSSAPYLTLPVDQPGIIRTTHVPTASNRPIEYHPDDLCVYGGAALTLYDDALRGLKRKHGVKSLEHYLRKRTTDIDMVWWPRTNQANVVVVSQSPAIIKLVEKFTYELQSVCEQQQPTLLSLFQDTLQATHTVRTLSNLVVTREHVVPAGVHKVKFTCTLDGTPMELCEISVHDTGSSQLFDEAHQRINGLQPMIDDPAYCHSRADGTNQSRVILSVRDIDIPVPNLKLYVKQQLFAFTNLIHIDGGDQKALTSFRRAVLLKNLLDSFTQQSVNKRNISEKINIHDVAEVKNDIVEMMEGVKRMFHGRIQPLCRGHRNQTDIGIQALCAAPVASQYPPSFVMTTPRRGKELSQQHYKQYQEELKQEQERLQYLVQVLDSAIEQAVQHNSPLFDAYMALYQKINQSLKTLEHALNHRSFYEQLVAFRNQISQFEIELRTIHTSESVSRSHPASHHYTSQRHASSHSHTSHSLLPSAALPPRPPQTKRRSQPRE